MKIAIFGRVTDNTEGENLRQFFDYLRVEGVSYSIFAPFWKDLCLRFPFLMNGQEIHSFVEPADIQDARFIFSFGGDGTMLEAVNFAGKLQIPILGVNMGRLGYLTCITQKEVIAATSRLLKEIYRIEQRSLLSVISEPAGIFTANNNGINDLTIHKSNTNEMITVHAYLNGEFLNSYRGDGLIVATPTGSTAYSLSCGGPIIFPSSATFVITPVAPHSLTVRPVVIPDDWVISLEVEARSGEVMVSLDTRTELVKSKTALAIKKSAFQVKIVRLHSVNYIDNLRNSLMWGSDKRNS